MNIEATDWSWSVLFADFDLDGFQDVFFSNGIPTRPNNLDYMNFIANDYVQANASDLEFIDQMPKGEIPNQIFKNDGGNNFQNNSSSWLTAAAGVSNGAIYVDLDRDGDLDIVTNDFNRPVQILENRVAPKKSNWISVQLKATDKNTFALGATVQLFQNGKQQSRTITTTRGFESGGEALAHFGLTESNIDSILLRWPDGTSQKLEHPKGNQYLVIEKKNVRPYAEGDIAGSPLVEVVPGENIGLAFKHRENRFFDSDNERLIPSFLSTQGPALAVGDFSGDGLEDVFMGGATGQPSQLFQQKEDGTFFRPFPELFESVKTSEDVNAEFADLNGDNHLDLLIAVGGNQFAADHPNQICRIYLNDGKGKLSYSPRSIPSVVKGNFSTIKSGDFDHDGDLDLFLGAVAITAAYGTIPTSYLLENDGNAQFKEVTVQKAKGLSKAGMVKAAHWEDLNADGKLDLLIVGEWMPVQLWLQGTNGTFKKSAIVASHGWWNSIAPIDKDGDGDQDYFLGNHGHNNFLDPIPRNPVRCYVKDFDANGATEPIMTYYRHGEEYTVVGRDVLSKQMTVMRRRFPDYASFAKTTFPGIFPGPVLQGSTMHRVNNFANAFLINEGNGKFSLQPLEERLQIAPLASMAEMDINQDGRAEVFLAGNFYDHQPYIGRMDASRGHVLLNNKDSLQVLMPQESGLYIEGQVRNMRSIKLATGAQVILVARNNEPLEMIRPWHN